MFRRLLRQTSQRFFATSLGSIRHSPNVQFRTKRPGNFPKLILSASIVTWLGLSQDGKTQATAADEEANPELIDTIKRGVLTVREGEVEQGVTILHAALSMANKLGHQDGIIYIHALLASIAYNQGEYIKAEKLYKDVIQRQINKGIDAEDNSVVEMSLKLAVIYAEWKQHDKAKAGFKYCIETQEKKMKSKADTSDDTHALWGMSQDWFAQYLLSNGRYQEAFNQFQEAFLTSCELFGNTHPQSLVLMNSLGTVCSLMGEDAKAISYFTKAVNIAKKTASENLSTFLVNLGMAKIKMGLKGDANSACQEALLIAQRNDLSDVCSEAEECIKQASNMK